MTAPSARPTVAPDVPGLLPGELTADDWDPAPGRTRRSPRDWFVDTAAFLLAAGIGTIGLVDDVVADGFTPLRAADITVGVALCVALWWRRRFPVQLALITAVASVLSLTSGGAAVIALFSVAVHRRFAVAGMVTGVHVVLTILNILVYGPGESSWLFALFFSALMIVAVVAWGMFIRARRQLIHSLRDRARQAESEAQLRVEQARHRERERIAREMHDMLAHRLSLLSVHANALIHRRGASPEKVVEASEIIRDGAHQALQDLREVIGVLRMPSADAAPGASPPSLNELSAVLADSRRAGMRVEVVDATQERASLPTTVDRCAYRVVQEALTNARKHAAGAEVTVQLTGAPGSELQISVRNGPGETAAPSAAIPGTGTGLVGLRERVRLAGGELSSGQRPDGGFDLSARLPWPADSSPSN